ncbi:MAG: transcription antitermination factor NusB [Lachnospiraceae bacterium]|jgi:N utilization substance protein B|nr:transcription antitermination factor NusB [Lachnospiraceae bacterium]MCI9100556.1 transcription antitermination factor NusB [Lachnospiraceae bacterium]MCI9356056.1 transcription antitermination factor NusB [Lachnospiraceae bacterium]
MGRRGLRENIFKLLFMSEFHQPEELEHQVGVYLGEMESLGEQDADYMQKKYESIREHILEIDSMLNEISRGWKTSRMSRVDLNILRLAVYEIYHDEDVPEKVAANEAVEIAKKYGGEESASFINGLLGKVIRTRGEQHS